MKAYVFINYIELTEEKIKEIGEKNMRIYVLEYDMTFMGNAPSEKRTEYFQLEERQAFLKRYDDLKNKYYNENLKAYVFINPIELTEEKIKEMKDAI